MSSKISYVEVYIKIRFDILALNKQENRNTAQNSRCVKHNLNKCATKRIWLINIGFAIHIFSLLFGKHRSH